MKFLPVAFAAMAALALPAGANARTPDLVRGAKLQAVTGQMALSESRCPPGVGGSDCGHQKLTTTFKAGPGPATRNTRGKTGFPLGVVISGQGTGTCSADSPPSIVTAPDGSMQILAGAERIEPTPTKSTQVVIGAGSRGARWAWLEPLDPGFDCNYFDQPDTTLAVPAPAGIPRAVTSRWISPRVLRRSRFTVRINGKSTWTSTAGDGTKVTGTGTWTLTLEYTRAGQRTGPSFVA